MATSAARPTAAAAGVTVHDFDGSDDGRWHHRLTVTCDDRAGLLADLSEHLRAHDVDIVSAAVATDTESGHIVDSFAVRDHAAPPREAACVRATQSWVAPERAGSGPTPLALLPQRRCSRAAGYAPRTLSGAVGCACGQAGAEAGAQTRRVAESHLRCDAHRFATLGPEAACRPKYSSHCATPCGRSPSAPCTPSGSQADQPPRLPPPQRPGLHGGPTAEGATRRSP